MLVGHEVSTVQRSGWTGIKNGKLLGLAASEFDVFLTMDGNLEFQQNLSTLPIAVLVVEAVSNRMGHLVPLVPGILRELGHNRAVENDAMRAALARAFQRKRYATKYSEVNLCRRR